MTFPLELLFSGVPSDSGPSDALGNLFPVAMKDRPQMGMGQLVEPGGGPGGGGLARAAPQASAPEIIPPASEKADLFLNKIAKGDLAHALASVDSYGQLPAVQRVPGYYQEIKNAIIRQASPAELQRVHRLETLQEQLGGELYGGEPRGLVNWLRLRNNGALPPPTE